MRANVFYNPPALAKANFVSVAAVRKKSDFPVRNFPDSEKSPANPALIALHYFVLVKLYWVLYRALRYRARARWSPCTRTARGMHRERHVVRLR
jgi:hypothetical protein